MADDGVLDEGLGDEDEENQEVDSRRVGFA